MIDLHAHRVIPISDRGHDYKLVLAAPTRKQWLKYFESIISTSENVKGDRVDSFDSTGARLELVTELLVGAEGYAVPGGGAISELEGWRDKIPPSHRLMAGNVLISVTRKDDDGLGPIMLGCETVELQALWYRGGNAMSNEQGLRHVFMPPSVEQQRRYNRDLSRSQIIGGSRTGKTRWLGAQATLVALYDELIVEVEGYAYSGDPLGTDRDEIAARMDTYHKVVAAETLFTPMAPAIDSPEK